MKRFELYRHYTGNIYMLRTVMFEYKSRKKMYLLLNTLSGAEIAVSEDDFNSDADIDDVKNIMKQDRVFEPFELIAPSVENFTTKELERELAKRADSVFNRLSIEGFNDRVFATEYVVGYKHEPRILWEKKYPRQVEVELVTDTLEEAQDYLKRGNLRKEATIFKRTYIEEG